MFYLKILKDKYKVPMEWWCDGTCGTGIRRVKENKEKHYV